MAADRPKLAVDRPGLRAITPAAANVSTDVHRGERVEITARKCRIEPLGAVTVTLA
jgi:hypothetical protein